MKSKIYYLVYIPLYLLSLLPFWVLYLMSDVLSFFLYYLVRYRRGIVRRNLCNSFPEKNIPEIIRIEKGFYSFFSDYIVETVKLCSVSEHTIKKRMKFEHIDQLEADFKAGRSASVYLAHYGNWEWISTLPLHVNNGDFCGQVYHPLRSKAFDSLMLKIRGRFHAFSIAKQDVLRVLIRWKRGHKKTVVGYISDQIPKMDNIHHWITFLNQDTPVFTGAERLSGVIGAVVYFGRMRRESRGHYVCSFIKMSDDASKEPLFALTERYFSYLESVIRETPQYWLWTHNRWKRTREDFNKSFSEEERNRRLHRI